MGCHRGLTWQTFLLLVCCLCGMLPGGRAQTVPADAQCGQTKGCFSDCGSNSQCGFLVTWTEDGQNVLYTLATQTIEADDSYVVLGYSTDTLMGGDYVIGCRLIGSAVTVFVGENTGGKSSTQARTDGDISLVSSTTDNGVLTCTVSRPIAASGFLRPAANQDFYYLLARGTTSGNTVGYHGKPNRFISTQKLSSASIVHDGGMVDPTDPPTATTSVPGNPDCGTSQSCFASCSDTACDFLASWKVSGANIEYTLATSLSDQVTSYVLLGLSSDQSMGGDYVIGCWADANNQVSKFTGENPSGYSRVQAIDDPDVSLVSSEVADGTLRCTVRRPLSANALVSRVAASQEYYYFLARGWVDGTRVRKHKDRFISQVKLSTDPSSIDNLPYIDPSVPSGTLVRDPECGNTKGCFSDAGGTFEIAWQPVNQKVAYTIRSLKTVSGPPFYFALGFSSDGEMGSDSIIGAAVDASSNSVVFNAKNEGKSSSVSTPIRGTELISSNMDNGVYTFVIHQEVAPADWIDVQQKWRLLFARGSAGFSNGAVSSIGKHPNSENRFVSGQAVSSDDLVDVTAKKIDRDLVKLHGCLMILAWVFFSSMGIVAARYYKPVWTDMLCSQKVWFQIHRTCMILVFCATIAGFVVIFVEVEDWSDIEREDDEYLESHPILGVIVTSLTVINPLMALIRPHPGTPKRPIFNWAHWFVGTAAQIMGVVTIFFGLELFEDEPDYLIYILAGFVGWYLFVELLLITIQCCCKKPSRQEMYEMNDDDGYQKATPPAAEENPQAIKIKKFILVLHFLVVTSVAAVLIGLLADSD